MLEDAKGKRNDSATKEFQDSRVLEDAKGKRNDSATKYFQDSRVLEDAKGKQRQRYKILPRLKSVGGCEGKRNDSATKYFQDSRVLEDAKGKRNDSATHEFQDSRVLEDAKENTTTALQKSSKIQECWRMQRKTQRQRYTRVPRFKSVGGCKGKRNDSATKYFQDSRVLEDAKENATTALQKSSKTATSCRYSRPNRDERRCD